MQTINESKYIYITFDPYYGVDEYNSFLTAAKNNGIEYQEFIYIKPPHNRYIYLKDSDAPKFLNYDIASSSQKQWLVSVIKPRYPNEAYLLRRRDGQDVSYYKYIIPKDLIDLVKEDYVCVFKGFDHSELKEWSENLGSSRVYKLGKAKRKGYNIYISTNKYIKGFVPESRVLLEYDKIIPKNQGYIEYELNYKVLVSEKLMNKTYELEYYEDGKRFPLKSYSFI